VPGFIDLHAHTNESDGSLTPQELVQLAKRNGLDALAITDHDTFAGYEKAIGFARDSGLELVRGIELNSRFHLTEDDQARYVHVLAYFPTNDPSADFHTWLDDQRADRRSRNRKLVDALQHRGLDVTLQEVEARGRSLAGRPHFARILVEKGYAKNSDDAFRRYIGEEAPSYVQRESKTTEEVVRIVAGGGGVPVIAHPIRIGLARDGEREVFLRLKREGLLGLEVYHSEHSPVLQAHYRKLAEELELLPTGGSDFHGEIKPDIELGSGFHDNVRVPREVLDRLRR
jgi:predicted metal-dependent phosphoesterase TrpH